jgi:hypothetical protein
MVRHQGTPCVCGTYMDRLLQTAAATRPGAVEIRLDKADAPSVGHAIRCKHVGLRLARATLQAHWPGASVGERGALEVAARLRAELPSGRRKAQAGDWLPKRGCALA